MKESGRMITSTGQESTLTSMAKDTKDSGRMIRGTGQESTLG